MSNVQKFTFEKSYKELDINGKIYRIETNDDAQRKYRRAYKDYLAKSDELLKNAPNLETCSDEEYDTYQGEQLDIAKNIIETFLGDDTFDELYELAGRSLLNLVPLTTYISEMLISEDQRKQVNEFLKNGKK